MGLSRRGFLRTSVAGLAAGFGVARGAWAQDRFDQKALLAFDPVGALTLIHMGDLHGQMMPHYDRPAEVKIGVGAGADQLPHLSGEAFRIAYGLGGGTPMDYAHTHENFDALARVYGKIGGLDRIATMVRAIRASRPGALFLTGRLTHHPLLPDATPILSALEPDMSARDTVLIERGGAKIALIRSPARQADLGWQIEDAQALGAAAIVCVSGLGFDADLALARDHPAIDVILSCASRHALPEPFGVGRTQIIASGTRGRFVSRVDLEVAPDGVREVAHRLIPMFSDLIAPDRATARMITAARAPFEDDLGEVLAQAATLLFHRATLSSPWDDVICAALMAHHGAEMALSPGVRTGNTILPGQEITREDVLHLCGPGAAQSFRRPMSGAQIKALLEADVDRYFHRDPARRGNGELLRLGGVGFHLDVAAGTGQRISKMRMLADEAPVQPDQSYVVAGWARKPEAGSGAPLWQIVESFLRAQGLVHAQQITAVTLVPPK